MVKKESSISEVKKLKSFKKRSGWSYQKISSHMGIHSQTIYFWLTGKFKPSGLAKEKIRQFLNDYDY